MAYQDSARHDTQHNTFMKIMRDNTDAKSPVKVTKGRQFIIDLERNKFEDALRNFGLLPLGHIRRREEAQAIFSKSSMESERPFLPANHAYGMMTACLLDPENPQMIQSLIKEMAKDPRKNLINDLGDMIVFLPATKEEAGALFHRDYINAHGLEKEVAECRLKMLSEAFDANKEGISKAIRIHGHLDHNLVPEKYLITDKSRNVQCGKTYRKEVEKDVIMPPLLKAQALVKIGLLIDEDKLLAQGIKTAADLDEDSKEKFRATVKDLIALGETRPMQSPGFLRRAKLVLKNDLF